MKKVLITGASGMLGSYVGTQLQGSDYEIIAPPRSQFDLADAKGCRQRILDLRPDAILHLAAETDVDLCERDPGHAALLNVRATGAIACAAQEVGAWLLYVSTASVFGAEKMIHNEIDLPAPVNYYGRSKLFGEYEVNKYCPSNSLIVRTCWVMGGGAARDHKFVGKIVQQIRQGAPALRAVADSFGTITPASHLARFICNSLAARRVGLFHFAAKGVVSRLDIAREIANHFSYKGEVQPVSACLFPLSAPRPTFEAIESIYLQAEDIDQPRSWREHLAEYLAEFS
jgi:dTDP-4-dehydrorhamnose reductase